jgi:NAD-dependent dihydropyrimidine dehydrogenase PreA subunit
MPLAKCFFGWRSGDTFCNFPAIFRLDFKFGWGYEQANHLTDATGLLAIPEAICDQILKTQVEEKMSFKVTVDKDKCTGDAECVDVCPVDVYELIDGKAEPVNEDECLGCESCVEVCEQGAITVEEV